MCTFMTPIVSMVFETYLQKELHQIYGNEYPYYSYDLTDQQEVSHKVSRVHIGVSSAKSRDKNTDDNL